MREEADDQILLNLLNAVERNSQLTQRSAAQELGIALGLANAYVRRCVRKGLIKIQQVPANRYAYYLTAQGFGEKARLTAKYLSVSFGLFRAARQQFDEIFADCDARSVATVILAGASDLAEIAVLCARERPVTVLGIVDSSKPGTRIAGFEVVSNLGALPPADVIIITDMLNPQATYEFLAGTTGGRPVLAPPLLGLSRNSATPAARERVQ